MECGTQWPGSIERNEWSGSTLATLAAALDSQIDSEQSERAFPLLLVSALTLFAVAINGYHPCAEDGGLYMAGVKRLLDPALYPHSTAFVLEPMRHSLFAPTVAAAVRLTRLSLPIVLLALHLASIWLTLFAAWMLASRCWPSRPARAGAVVLLACWLALPIAGTGAALHGPIRHRAQPLHPRNASCARRRARHAQRAAVHSIRKKDSAAFSSAPQASPSLLQCIL